MATDGLIEPDSFDVIVVGTGLQEAMLAAAAAASRRLSVLHLDPHEFYGAHWASLDLEQFSSWATNGGRFSVPSQCSPHPAEFAASGGKEESAHDLTGLISSMAGQDSDHSVGEESLEKIGTLSIEEEINSSGTGEAPGHRDEVEFEEIQLESGKEGLFSGFAVFEGEGSSLGPSRSYNIDLCGPRSTFCGSNLVNLLLRSGASHYLDFKGVDASYIWTGEVGGLSAVPSSRADVFRDRALSLPDKRFLMRFFKLVMPKPDDVDASPEEQRLSVDISEEDLDAPFLDFMQRQRLPTSIQSILVYAIALVDEDQQLDAEDSSALLKTRDGLQKLALYLTSVARFASTSAFLYPLYGQGELPQAFCRSAAVNGALYVLRRPVKALLLDKVSKECKGVRTLKGQVLYSKRLILGPSVLPKPSAGVAREDDLSDDAAHLISTASATTSVPGEKVASKVARCVCITDRSLCEGQSTVLVIFPPRSVHEKGSYAIRALQLDSSASVCPEDNTRNTYIFCENSELESYRPRKGLYIVQLSTICSEDTDGRIAIEAAVQALFANSDDRETKISTTDSIVTVSKKPNLLWSVFYVQALHTNQEDLKIPGVAFCKMPDGTLDGEKLLTETEKLFREMFPDEDYFPQASQAKDPAEDDDPQET